MTRTLIVGAGAVGSVYGYFVSRGGADVSYLVKPKHVAERQNGMRLYQHHAFGSRETIDWKDYRLVDEIDRLPSEPFDLIIVTVPSDALRSGDWLSRLSQKDCVKNALWVGLSPGDTDPEYLLEKTGLLPEDFAEGTIPIISYWGPLPGEEMDPPGYAFWIPPGSRFTLYLRGGSEKWKPYAELFERGRFKTSLQPIAEKKVTVGPALLRTVVAALQNSEWSFQKMLNGPQLQIASEAAKEAIAIYAARAGSRNPAAGWLRSQTLSPLAIRGLLAGVSSLAPFDFEAFLRVHFTKVETQMKEGLRFLVSEGNRLKLPTSYLRQL